MTCQFVNGKKISSHSFGPISDGQYNREPTVIHNMITRDGRSGFLAEPNRYHLYFSYACPWAHRTLIMLMLKKLSDIISYSKVNPVFTDSSWEFGPKGSECEDPLFGYHYTYELYLKNDPHYTGRITVPILFDKKTNVIVNNESSEIMRIFNSEFKDYADPYDFYPEHLQNEINEINDYLYHAINNGVYKCGFAENQSAYDEDFNILFDALDEIEKRLNGQDFLVNNQFTESDIRFFTTLVRFDAVYYTHFKCNKKKNS